MLADDLSHVAHAKHGPRRKACTVQPGRAYDRPAPGTNLADFLSLGTKLVTLVTETGMASMPSDLSRSLVSLSTSIGASGLAARAETSGTYLSSQPLGPVFSV